MRGEWGIRGTSQGLKTIPLGREELTGALLAILFREFKPTSEDPERLRFDFEEGNAATEIGLDVNDFGFGMEEFFAGEDLDEHLSVLRKRIHHVQVAAVKA